MAKKEATELEKSGPNFVSVLDGPLPEHLVGEDQGYGFEGMENSDVTIPRLAVCQSMTPARKEGNEQYIENLKEGDMFNTVTRVNYGRRVIVTPVFFFKNRIMFKDLNQGGGIVCQAPDGKSCQLNHGGPCLHGGFGPSGEKPECNEFFNYLALRHKDGTSDDEPEVIVLSFKSTAMKKAKDWNAQMRMAKAKNMFSLRWEVETLPAKKNQFDYFTVNFNPVGYNSADMYNYAKGSFENFKTAIATGAAKVDLEGMNSEDARTDM